MRRQDKMPARNKKNFRPTSKGAGMTRAGVAAYRRANPGSKLKTAVTGKVKPGSKAAKRKFKVYPSAYANAYASKICAGKIKDPSGVKRKDFRGSKAKGGLIGELNRPDRGYKNGGKVARGCGAIMSNRRKKTKMM